MFKSFLFWFHQLNHCLKLIFSSIISATVLMKRGRIKPMFKITCSKSNERFVVKSVKEKKITKMLNVFFVRSSNGSMVAKSHRQGMGQKGSYLCKLPRESHRPETKYLIDEKKLFKL